MQYNKTVVHNVKWCFTMWNNSRISYDTKKVKIKMEAIMNKVLEEIKKIGIVPVVVLDDAKDAAPLAKALCEGGLPCAEVTFRTAAAEESSVLWQKNSRRC